MPFRKYRPVLPFLLLLFSGTICASMIVPYMGFFIVEGLKQDPWVISLYSLLTVSLTVVANRQFARRIDRGDRVHPLVGMAAGGYLVATLAITLQPTLPTVLTLGVLGFGISSSAISTMFSLGGRLAEREGLDRSSFNAFMRATTSTGWMVGPAAAFLVADLFGPLAVFHLSLGTAALWLALWWWGLPRDVTAEPKPLAGAAVVEKGNRDLWLAAAFVFGLSSAHSLTFTALPLFYVREVGLAGYAPGVAFSVKTFVEVIAIFSTPMLIARLGMQKALLATALLAAVTIEVLASVNSLAHMIIGAALEGLYYGLYASLGISYIQSFARDRPAAATAIYWNTLMVSGILAGPAVGMIAQTYGFRAVIHAASAVALVSVGILVLGIRASGKPISRNA